MEGLAQLGKLTSHKPGADHQTSSLEVSGAVAQQIPTSEPFMPLSASRIVRANSVKEVQQAITDAAAAGLRVRPMGAGQSWVPRLLTSDVLVATTGLNRIHKIDRERKTIDVDGGANLGDITRALEAYNLALPSLAFMPEATIAGIISTATHGTSHKWGTLSDAVVSLEMVLASGEVKRLGPDSASDELRAARVSVGMLGVITRVELQAIEMPWVRHDNFRMDIDTFLRDLPSLQAKYEHMWAHWELGTENITIDCLEARTKRSKGFYTYVDDRDRQWQQLPIPVRYLNTPLRRKARSVLKAVRSVKAMLGSSPGSLLEAAGVRISMQYGVPAANLQSAITAIKNSDLPKLYAGRDLEFKFLKGSELSFLGPNADGDSVLFNVYWLVPSNQYLNILDPFERLMRGLKGRPHWGKYHDAVDTSYMLEAYPQWNAFENVRARLDPAGMFSAIKAPPADQAHYHSMEAVSAGMN